MHINGDWSDNSVENLEVVDRNKPVKKHYTVDTKETDEIEEAVARVIRYYLK